MKKLFARAFTFSPGFTMIELLIVISILGILAVAVLSAINPVEQINRGRDTASRSDAEQLLNAIDRFNAFQGYFPWMVGQGDTADALDWQEVSADGPYDSGGTCTVLMKLGLGDSGLGCDGTDELKESYIQRITSTTSNPLYIYNRGQTGDSTYVCFRPRSKAFQTEANLRAGETNGQLPADYPAEAVGNADPNVCGEDGNCVCLP